MIMDLHQTGAQAGAVNPWTAHLITSVWTVGNRVASQVFANTWAYVAAELILFILALAVKLIRKVPTVIEAIAVI